MITKRTKYALKTLLHLAKRRDQKEPIQAAEIAEKESIPLKFLEQILVELRRKGMVESRKGRSGGYRLAVEPGDVSLIQILRLIEGPQAPVPCLSFTQNRGCEDCNDATTCGVRLILKRPYELMVAAAENTTLLDGLELSSPDGGNDGERNR